MAHTTVITEQTYEGARKVVYATLTMTSTYTTGGEPVTPAEFGLTSFVAGSTEPSVNGSGVVAFTRFKPSTSTVQIYGAATGAEVSNGGAVSGYTWTVRAVGF